MPTYTYQCPHDHVLEAVRRMSEDHKAPERCVQHDCDAPWTWTKPNLYVVGISHIDASDDRTPEQIAAATAAPPLAFYNFRCSACGHGFDELNDRRAGETPESGRPCPKCNAHADMAATVPRIDATLSEYPYWSDVFNCEVTSPGHRRSLMFAKGLVEQDGDQDDKWFSEARDEAARYEKSATEYEQALEHSPDFRNYREYRDKGAVPVTAEEQAYQEQRWTS